MRVPALLIAVAVLAFAAGGVHAQQAELAPSLASTCLTSLSGMPKPAYPDVAYERKDGGTVDVELTFAAPDRAPRVKLLGDEVVLQVLTDAVETFAVGLRLPCMPAGAEPVKLRQVYVFTPNDGRKVAASEPRDVADAARRVAMKCRRHVNGETRPEYPTDSRRFEEEGPVLLRLTFNGPNDPPEVDVVASARYQRLRNEGIGFAKGLRLPCMDRAATGPIAMNLTLQFRLQGAARTVLRDLSLAQFVGGAVAPPKPVFFDFNTMGCPFDVRVAYYRPHMRNGVREIETSLPSRRPFLDWLSRIELKLPAATALSILGDELTVSVPCGRLDL